MESRANTNTVYYHYAINMLLY